MAGSVRPWGAGAWEGWSLLRGRDGRTFIRTDGQKFSPSVLEDIVPFGSGAGQELEGSRSGVKQKQEQEMSRSRAGIG